MNREEFKQIVAVIDNTYQSHCIKSKSVYELWYSLLKDMDYKTVSSNLAMHLRTNQFAPTIADLRKEQTKKGIANFNGRYYDMVKLERALLGVDFIEIIDDVVALEEKT